MGRLRSSGLWLAAAIFSTWGITGCGGHAPGGVSPYAASVTLSPATSASVQLGAVFAFSATARNSSGSSTAVTFTYASSDTSIVSLAPGGVACAGHWDAGYTTCTPGTTGVAMVTAAALGATSPPTYVFVHPPIDNIKVSGVLLNGLPIQEPCLSQGKSMTVEAHAYSQGSDITASVGPFTWSANNSSVVKLTSFINPAAYPLYPFATNLATATASTPGMTQIYATAGGGVSSDSFYQPQYTNSQGATSPLLDFFETCPIQNITLELGPAGSLQTGQTSFVTSKGTAETANAVLTDVMGNNSLLDSGTPVSLSKIPLTWTASHPTVVQPATGCTESCVLNLQSPGAGSVTASCSPPTCNIGFPDVPVALSSPTALAACTQFFQLSSCQQFIPLPVYASPLPPPPTAPPPPPILPASISGVVTGATAASTVLATSLGCESVHPLDCTTYVYNVPTSKSVAGNATPLPFSPNSLLFDLAGDKAYIGSQFGAVSVNPSNIGTSNNPFGSLGSLTGNVLATSSNGGIAIFSNSSQVFVANTASSSAAVTALNISNASAAAFSPDGLKAFIFGFDGNGNPNLYIYSTLQALQTIPLPAGTIVNSITSSTNAAFTYVVETSTAGSAVTVYNNCVHDVTSPQLIADTFPLTAVPISFKPLPDGLHFIALETNGTFDYITAVITGIPAATPTAPATSLCPMTVTHNDPRSPKQNISLNQGALHPLDFFTSADGTLVYVLASDRASVLVYNFATGAVTGIELTGNATPLSGAMTPDAGTIVINGSDGLLHEVSTALGGTDMVPPASFPNLPNYLNPFCTYAPAQCTLNLMASKP